MRTFSFRDLVADADDEHSHTETAYRFNGGVARFKSTDKGDSGIYGPTVTLSGKIITLTGNFVSIDGATEE